MIRRRLRRFMAGALGHALARLAAWLLCLVRLSCRRRVVDDPRPRLREVRQPYLLALLHAQQLAAVMLCDEKQLAAMVSRSADGELLTPFLRCRNVLPVRGSSDSGGRDKGGVQALRTLQRHVAAGGTALLAVDGPRGPRGQVSRGIVGLARRTGAVILPVMAHASRKKTWWRSWDRFELPLPFGRLSLHFGEQLRPPASPADDPLAQAELAARLGAMEAAADDPQL